MIKLPQGEGEFMIVTREELSGYQNIGWRAVGVTSEDVVTMHNRQVPCVNGAQQGNTCRHGYHGNCTMTDFVEEPIKVTKPLVVIARDADSVLEELSTLKEEMIVAQSEKEMADARYREQMDKHTELQNACDESDRVITALHADVAELTETNARVCANNKETYRENAKLRTKLSTEALAQLNGARELALTGEPINPLAFVAMLDTFDAITAAPSEYVGVLASMIRSGIITDMHGEDDTRMIKVNNHDRFFGALRELDARKRLNLVEEGDEACQG